MNGKKIACIVLLMIVGVFAYAGQIMHKKADAKVTTANAAEDRAIEAEGQLKTAQISVATTRDEAERLLKFLEAWQPHAERFQTQLEVESAVQSLIRSTGVLVMSQKFESRDTKINPVVGRVIRAALVVEDEYAKVMNWMGEIERRIPITRVMTCQITGGETGRLVKAEVSFEIPLMNLSDEQSKDAAKKKKA
jgi:tetrahydromethanopterin S-methyltransferase subunit G